MIAKNNDNQHSKRIVTKRNAQLREQEFSKKLPICYLR